MTNIRYAKNGQILPQICIFGCLEPNIGLSGPFGAIYAQQKETMWLRCQGGLTVLSVAPEVPQHRTTQLSLGRTGGTLLSRFLSARNINTLEAARSDTIYINLPAMRL